MRSNRAGEVLGGLSGEAVAKTAKPKTETHMVLRRLAGLVALTRPRQWLKNGLVAAAAIFGGKATDVVVVGRIGVGFVAFCALAGSVYALNDLHDREKDRYHPLKRLRPLASGIVPPGWAWAASTVLAVGGLWLLLAVDPSSALFGVGYLGLNLFYTAWAKNQVILDVLVVASGFLIRVMAGGALARVTLSPWLLACTLLLALTLALGKRRGELASLEGEAQNHRPVMNDYSVRFLDQMIAVVGSVTITCYILYTLLAATAAPRPYLFASTLPVIYGVLRYFYLVYHQSEGEAPESIPYSDRPMLIAVVAWLSVVVGALYL